MFMESIGNYGVQFRVDAGEQKVIRFKRGIPKTEVELDQLEVTGDAVCAFRLLLYRKKKQLVVLRQGLLFGRTEGNTEFLGKYALEGIAYDTSEYELRLEVDSYHECAIMHLTFKVSDDYEQDAF
jgi:hypothetical protein